jgi:hypothetical protein
MIEQKLQSVFRMNKAQDVMLKNSFFGRASDHEKNFRADSKLQ